MMKHRTTVEKWCIAGIVLLILALIPLCVFATVWLLHTAWTTVAVPVFHWPPLTFWQVFWIWIVITIVGGCFRASVSTNDKK
mgnify:CR=1 FL=1